MTMTETQRLTLVLDRARGMNTAEIVQAEVDEFRRFAQPRLLEAEAYYRNRSAVQRKTARYESRSNTKIEHSLLRKLVDQKTNYLLAKPFTISAKSAAYEKALNGVFDARARAEVKSLGKEAIKKGIGWVQLYIGEEGTLRLKRLPTEQILPEWADDEHTRLDCLIRVYPQVAYEGREKVLLERAELWSAQGVERFVRRMGGGRFAPDADLGARESHFAVDDAPWNWDAPPFLWVRYCEEELPLLHFVRELIDDYNWQVSVSADILRDAAQLVYVLRNYGGENLEQFVREMRESLAVQVEGDGGVDTLQAQLDMNAVNSLLDRHRRDLYDLARSVDTQDPNLGDASGQALKFRYADLDMDCNDLLRTETAAVPAGQMPFRCSGLRYSFGVSSASRSAPRRGPFAGGGPGHVPADEAVPGRVLPAQGPGGLHGRGILRGVQPRHHRQRDGGHLQRQELRRAAVGEDHRGQPPLGGGRGGGAAAEAARGGGGPRGAALCRAGCAARAKRRAALAGRAARAGPAAFAGPAGA